MGERKHSARQEKETKVIKLEKKDMNCLYTLDDIIFFF